MKPEVAISLLTFAWWSCASLSIIDSTNHFQIHKRHTIEHDLHGIERRTTQTRSRSNVASSVASAQSPRQGQLSKASKGVSKPSKSPQQQSGRSVTKKRNPPAKPAQDAWAKYTTHGGSSAYIGDHSSPMEGSVEGWQDVSHGVRKSDRIISSKLASTGVVPDEGNTKSHHTSAQGQRVRVWLTNKDASQPVHVEASGPGYQTVRHTVSHSDGGTDRQYRAGSPSRPVTVKTSFKGPSDAYLEAINPVSSKWNSRISRDRITDMQNA